MCNDEDVLNVEFLPVNLKKGLNMLIQMDTDQQGNVRVQAGCICKAKNCNSLKE